MEHVGFIDYFKMMGTQTLLQIMDYVGFIDYLKM